MHHAPARAAFPFLAATALLACSPAAPAASRAPATTLQARAVATCPPASAAFCWVNPLPQGSSLSGAWLATPAEGWVVGPPEMLLRWDGAGLVPAPVTGAAALRAIWGSAPDDVWAAGDAVLHHDGRSWSVVADAPAGPWYAIHGTSRSDVWLAGARGAVAHWDGVRWSRRPLSSEDDLVAISAVPGQVFAAAGTGGAVYRWDGTAWSVATQLPLRTASSLLATGHDDFWVGGVPGAANGAAGARGANLFHVTGAGSWEPIAVAGVETVTAIVATAPDRLWVLGADGAGHGLVAGRSRAGWTVEALPAPALTARAGAGSGDALLVVVDGGQGFARPADGGGWRALHHGVPGYLQAATTAGMDAIFAATLPSPSSPEASLLRISDGSPFPLPVGVPDVVYGVWANGPRDLWAGTLENGFLHFDGVAWRARVGGYAGLVDGVWASGPSDVWGVAGSYAVHFDGHAVVQHALPASGARRLFGFSPRDVWAVGGTASVLHWDGIDWRALPIPRGPVTAVWGSAADDVWFVGDGGLALRWDGRTLTPTPTGSDATLRAVAGSSASDVWAAGSGGTVLHFDGHGWAPVASGTRNTLAAVTVTEHDVYVAGDFGTILRHSR